MTSKKTVEHLKERVHKLEGYIYLVHIKDNVYKLGGTSNIKNRSKFYNSIELVLKVNDWIEFEYECHNFLEECSLMLNRNSETFIMDIDMFKKAILYASFVSEYDYNNASLYKFIKGEKLVV